MKPRVTVLIDTYNHERYIEQALVSAIEQDFPTDECEILVVDDGSTDWTPQIVGKFAPRVKLLRKKNGGQASAFNAAIPEARGELVAFLDGDDWFAPGKISACVGALEQNPSAAAVGHGHYLFREEAGTTEIQVPDRAKFLCASTPQSAIETFNAWRYLLLGALTVRMGVLRQLIPLPEALVFCADAPISMACMAKGVQLIDQPLFYYRHHASNLHAGAEGAKRLKRKLDMNAHAFEAALSLLLQMGTDAETANALVCPTLVSMNRQRLAEFGGSPLRTLRTEMRSFQYEHKDPRLSYLLFKFFVVGASALLLPPRIFYKGRDWYARKDMGRVREQFLVSDGARGRGINAR